MPQMFFLSALIMSAVLSFGGFIVNLFIAVINYKTWVQGHRMSSSDRILLSLGITRCLMLGLYLLYIACFFISPNIERSVHLPKVFLLFWIFLDSNGLWFVTLLNVLYCVKIANLQHSVFLLLKRNLSLKTPRLLLACVLISAFTTLPYVVFRQTLISPESVMWRNGTEFNVGENIFSLVISLLSSSFLQFIINVTSASLLINSLRRHMQMMQRHAAGFWNPRTEAHVGAMKLMVYFLLLYVPYAVATLSHYFFPEGMDLGIRSIFIIISNFYVPGHSVLIVLTHPKLKSKAKKILCFNK